MSSRRLLEHHRQWLAVRAIADDIAAERGYYSETSADALADLGFASYQRRVPCLVIPRFTTAGVNGDYQIRPDHPREQRRNGSVRRIKYETRIGSTAMVDVHPRTVPILRDPSVMLLMNEAPAKGDAALSGGFHSLNVAGVYGWLGKNPYGGRCTIADFDDVALNGRRITIIVDSDGRDNRLVLAAATRVKKMLERRGAHVMIIVLPPGPDGSKQGLDDFCFAGGDLAALIAKAEETPSGIYVAAARRFHLTDYGNAERLVSRHGGDIRYSRAIRGWYVWSGRCWEPDYWALINRLAKKTVRSIYNDVELAAADDEAAAIVKHASASEAVHRLEAMIELAESEPGIPILPTGFDQDPFLLNVQNGTIDLRTGELRPHRRSDLISKLVPLDYDPDARCPRWEAFLREVTNDRPELVDFLHRAIGYALTGDTRERALFIGYGGGKNGKTKFYETSAALLGPYAAHTPVQTLLAKRDQDRPGNELAALRGVRFLFKEFFTYIPEFKLWLMTNHRPIIRETTNAIWDRVKLIPFDVRFYGVGEEAPPGAPRQDTMLSQTLREELPGILAWAVRGCLDWRRDGLGEPEAVRAATDAYRAEQDAIGGFLEEICKRDEQAITPSDALYTAYTAWFEDAGEPKSTKVSKKMFGMRLAEHGFTPGKTQGRPQVRVWFGIAFQADHDAPEPETPETSTKPDPEEAVDAFAAETHGDAYSGKYPHTSASGEKIPENASPCVYDENVSTPHEVITTGETLATVLPELLAADVLGLDVETTGLDPRGDTLQLVQLATRERAYLIDPATVHLVALTPLLATATSIIVGHNLGFDLAFLHAAGLPIPDGVRLFDTMLASQVHDGGAHANGAKTDAPSGAPGRGGTAAQVGYHSLAAVVHRWLGQVLDKTLQTSDWSGPLTEEQLVYAARDAAVLLPLRDVLDTALALDGLTAVAALEFAALPAVVWMESVGVPIDVASWTALRDDAAATLATLDTELMTALPGVNVDSPTQVIAALASLGIALPNAQEATLRSVVNQHPAIDLIVKRKEAKKRVSTYGESYLRYVHPVTGRIHGRYHLIGAASGRMACSTPNLQNIPRNAAYRACIRPPAGRGLIKADYSQIELRIAAQISGDTAMLEAFRSGEDLHMKTARAVLGREPTKEDRQLAKALNFGLLYGMGAERLRTYAQDEYGVTLSEGEATRFRTRFFQTYPGLRVWHQRHRGDDEISTQTLTGRRRHGVSRFPEKLNSPVQGTGADILKGALARLWEDRAAVPSAALILAVHDELVIEVDTDEAEQCADWLTAHMTAAGEDLLTEVPVVVEASIVADWSGTPAPMSTRAHERKRA